MKSTLKYTIILLLSIISTITAVNSLANINTKNNLTSETTLDNGLKIVVREDHRAPIIISQIWYKVGSSYETIGTTGISHMLEHMMFKSSKNLKDGEFIEIVTRNGGDQNAMTSNDFTAYYQLFSKDRLETSFKLESERMQNLLLDETAFNKERQVVIEERRMRVEDDPISHTYERLLATAYMGSPYQNPVIGWPDDLKNYRLEDLRSWYKKWYSPNNATIVVVGDVKPKEVFDMASKYFSDIEAKTIDSIKPRAEVKPLGLRKLHVKLPAKLPYLFMTYNVPSINTANDKQDVYSLEVINYILSGGKSARLPKNLVRKQELVTSVSSSYDSFNMYNGLFSINAIPAENKSIQQVEKAIRNQIKQLKTSLVKDKELERVKANLIANKIYEQDSLYYQALIIGILESINLSWRNYDNYINNLQAITPEQIQAAANKYFIDDRLTLAVLKPDETKI